MDLLPDLWRQEYWLPSGVTWRDVEQLADSDRPRPHDLLIALPLALGFVALRYVFERYTTLISLFCKYLEDGLGFLFYFFIMAVNHICFASIAFTTCNAFLIELYFLNQMIYQLEKKQWLYTLQKCSGLYYACITIGRDNLNGF